MKRNKHKLLSLGLAIGLGLGMVTAPVFAEQDRAQAPSAEAMAFDGLIVRPVSLAASLVSTAFFVVTLPFSVISGNAEQAADTMIATPFRYTFARPLGEMQYNRKP